MTWIGAWLWLGVVLGTVTAEGVCHDATSDSRSCISVEDEDGILDGTDSAEVYLLQTDLRLHRDLRVPAVSRHASGSHAPHSAAVARQLEKAAAMPKKGEDEVKIDISGDMDVDDLGSSLWQTGVQLTEIPGQVPPILTPPPTLVEETHPHKGGRWGFILGALVCVCGTLSCFVAFTILRSRYPMTFQNNLVLNSPPLDTIPDCICGWMQASWSETTEQVMENVGLDQAMLLEFMKMGMRVMLTISIPLFCVMGPIHALLGSQASVWDPFNYASSTNVEDGRYLCWIHAFIVWGIVFVVQASVHEAQKQFMKWRFQWLRDLRYPRANTVLVEGIPETHQSDAALKAFFDQMFGASDKVTSAYVVRKAPELEAAWKKREAIVRACAKARFKARKVNAGDADKEQAVRFQDELSQLEKTLTDEQQKVKSMSETPGPDGYHTSAAFVTFKEKSDALLALSTQVGDNADHWQMSMPPEPNSVIYQDLQQVSTTSQTLMALGYVLTAGLYIVCVPAVIGITHIAENGDDFGVLQPIWQAYAGALGLHILVSFMPTLLMCIFRCFTLKNNARAQQMLQNWYFLLQLVFVVVVAALSGSALHFAKSTVQGPRVMCEVLGKTIPSATSFFVSYVILQWWSHAWGLVRATPLLKWLFFRGMYDDETARQMAEPEEQDYNGIGSRSSRMTIHLVIGIVYGTLCPLVGFLVFVEFLVCRVVYGYLLPFAETKKTDLGGFFWVQQLRHVLIGNILYCILMTAILFGRAAAYGPGILAACSLVYIAWSMNRFEKSFSWRTLPFKELMDPSKSTQKQRSCAGEYLQPFMK